MRFARVFIAVLLAAPLALTSMAVAQRLGGPPGADATPVTPTNYRYGDTAHADLSGVWTIARPAGPAPKVPLTKPYIAKLDEARRRTDAGEPPATSVTRCLALGMPRFLIGQLEAIQTPAQLTMIQSVLTDVRRIYSDGRGHSADFEPSYNGDSIGHWEGDTLVVETTNLIASTMDEYGIPYSDKLSIVERMKRTSPTTMQVQLTLTDPQALTRPYEYTINYNLMPAGTRLEEYVCENNRNDPGDGTQGVVLQSKTKGKK